MKNNTTTLFRVYIIKENKLFESNRNHTHSFFTSLSFLLSLSRKTPFRATVCERERVMGEGKGSSLVHLLVIILCLVAFGFAIAAERRRSTVTSFFSLSSAYF